MISMVKFSETETGKKLIEDWSNYEAWVDVSNLVDQAYEQGQGCHDASKDCACYHDGRKEERLLHNKEWESEVQSLIQKAKEEGRKEAKCSCDHHREEWIEEGRKEICTS